jgi:hypothetical protein
MAQGGPASTWTFRHDGAQQLIEAVRGDGSQTVLESERYGYDSAGNRIQVVTGTTSPAVRNFAANNLNQLTSERGFGPVDIRRDARRARDRHGERAAGEGALDPMALRHIASKPWWISPKAATSLPSRPWTGTTTRARTTTR